MEGSQNESGGATGMRSLGAVLFVQTQNAFNDNFVKFVLMGLAMAVAADSPVGENVEFILAALIPIPFILFAPVAGWISDRYSKRNVIWWCVVGQVALFLFIGGCVYLRQVELAIFGFFLLAVQSTVFSPAKQGILKELVGTEKLSFANGMMSMLTMVGILGGMIFAGKWYDYLLAKYNLEVGVTVENAWRAAFIPICGVGLLSLVALGVAAIVERTKPHPTEKFSSSIWLRHFSNLKEMFADPVLKKTALFITAYWFVANFLGLGFVAFAKVMFPDAGREGRLTATGQMMIAVGIGLMIGSLIVSFISKNKIRLPFVPLGGIGMAIGLVGAGLFPPGTTMWFVSIGVIGFSSGFYVVPLNSHLQDVADESKRGTVIGALNLMTSFSGVVAIVAGLGLKQLGLSPSHQLLVFVIPVIYLSIFIQRSLKSLRVA